MTDFHSTIIIFNHNIELRLEVSCSVYFILKLNFKNSCISVTQMAFGTGIIWASDFFMHVSMVCMHVFFLCIVCIYDFKLPLDPVRHLSVLPEHLH